MKKFFMTILAACGALLLAGVSRAVGGTQLEEVLGGPPDTPQATRTRKIRSGLAFYARATCLMLATALVRAAMMTRRWIETRLLHMGRSSPGLIRPVGFDTIDSLGGFPIHDKSISLESAIGQGIPIGTYESIKAAGRPLSETIPQDPVFSGTNSFHDEGSTVQIQ